MGDIDPLEEPSRVAELERWRQFENEYELQRETGPGRLTVHYAKNDDSIARLRALVDDTRPYFAEVKWVVDDSTRHLQLVATGPESALASLGGWLHAA